MLICIKAGETAHCNNYRRTQIPMHAIISVEPKLAIW